MDEFRSRDEKDKEEESSKKARRAASNQNICGGKHTQICIISKFKEKRNPIATHTYTHTRINMEEEKKNVQSRDWMEPRNKATISGGPPDSPPFFSFLQVRRST